LPLRPLGIELAHQLDICCGRDESDQLRAFLRVRRQFFTHGFVAGLRLSGLRDLRLRVVSRREGGWAYRKIDAGSRTYAVLWGVKHGCTPDQNRIEHWRGNSEVSTFRLTTLDRTYHPYG
jgi:hypothetical protein